MIAVMWWWVTRRVQQGNRQVGDQAPTPGEMVRGKTVLASGSIALTTIVVLVLASHRG